MITNGYALLSGDIPMIGPYIPSPINKALNAQRNSLHRKPGEALDVKVGFSDINPLHIILKPFGLIHKVQIVKVSDN